MAFRGMTHVIGGILPDVDISLVKADLLGGRLPNHDFHVPRMLFVQHYKGRRISRVQASNVPIEGDLPHWEEAAEQGSPLVFHFL